MSIKADNTFRTLADKPLLAERQWHCAFGIHTWMPWSNAHSTKRGVYEYIEQFRECGYCNKTQRKQLHRT